jgi:hypothetical protein
MRLWKAGLAALRLLTGWISMQPLDCFASTQPICDLKHRVAHEFKHCFALSPDRPERLAGGTRN